MCGIEKWKGLSALASLCEHGSGALPQSEMIPGRWPFDFPNRFRIVADAHQLATEGDRPQKAFSSLPRNRRKIAVSGILGLGFNFLITQEYGTVELYIDRGNGDENARIFDQLHSDCSLRKTGSPRSGRISLKDSPIRVCRGESCCIAVIS